ncbi:uncharacterized protein V6R79_008391 [Siganus canaliculatus]
MERKDIFNNYAIVDPEKPHQCNVFCLGPLTFHSEAVGEKIQLSRSGHLAKRIGPTFRNGLVFSSRTLRINEKMCLRVEKRSPRWHGAMRVGFTNVPPTGRSQPLPSLAMPDLTSTPGHWGAPVPESICEAGSELEFWVNIKGAIYVSSSNGMRFKLYTGVDLTQPLWAFVDVYGQTRSVLLLGSRKRWMQCFTKESCPLPEHITSTDDGHDQSTIPDEKECLRVSPGEDSTLRCVVCMEVAARIILPCGHRCLCISCTSRVVQHFGCCPLCRHDISKIE